MGFNGAATLSSRKSGVTGQVLQIGVEASMGPRRYRRGNVAVAAAARVTKGLMLQWGRDVIVAEIAQTRSWSPTHRVLQWGRDVIVAEIQERASLTV